jgi:uncharacterized membrane protein
MDILGNDLMGAGASLLLLVLYHAFLRVKRRSDPLYTIQAVNALTRAAWVETVMTSGNKDVLAVQTLRNSIMGATFLSSTAVLLIIGVLTLTEQGDKLRTAWQAFDVFGTASSRLWLTKMLLLLVDLLVAFFSFCMAIRLFHHVGYMINVPPRELPVAMNAAHVTAHLNRAGKFYSVGMRAYYYTVPLLLWLFGPHFMLAGSVALVVALNYLDRTPQLRAPDR